MAYCDVEIAHFGQNCFVAVGVVRTWQMLPIKGICFQECSNKQALEILREFKLF